MNATRTQYNKEIIMGADENKEYVKRLKRIRNLKIRYLLVCFIGGRYKTQWLKKNSIFGLIGDDVLFQPRTLPNEPELIKIHNNVRIAADVTFYTHDVINNLLFKTIDKEDYIPHRSCIEIFDNVFVGGHSVIIGDVSIGPNAIVAAGSVVTKDVPEGSIVGGNPAKVIGTFEALHEKRKKEKGSVSDIKTTEEIWASYYANKKKEAETYGS